MRGSGRVAGWLIVAVLLTGCVWFEGPGPEVVAGPEPLVIGEHMPDLVGRSFSSWEDGLEGPLLQLHRRIGVQETRYVASHEAPQGIILEQSPAPGTPLATIGEWSLTVSAGGPAIDFEEVPGPAQDIARALGDDYDRSEPVLVLELAGGLVAYKIDDWLYADDCRAIEAAYRTFPDADYRTACPGQRGLP